MDSIGTVRSMCDTDDAAGTILTPKSIHGALYRFNGRIVKLFEFRTSNMDHEEAQSEFAYEDGNNRPS